MSTLEDDVRLKVLEVLVRDPFAPLSITLSGPGVIHGLSAAKTVRLIRNTEKLLKAIAAEVSPGHKINVNVRGIDNAGEAFTVRFEVSDALPRNGKATQL